jgi:tetratricopeptide (TPR) repeat protein
MTARARNAALAGLAALTVAVLAVLLVEPRWTADPPPPAVRQAQPPADTPRTYAQALARADREVAYGQARAAGREDQWLVLEGLARRQAARARLTGSFDDYAAAQATLDRAFAVASPGTGPHLSQAALHFTMHRLGEAERQLDLIDRYAVPPEAVERAEAAAMRGDIAFYRGDYPGALALYDRAEAIERGAGTAFRRAVHAAKTGRFDQAEAYFDRAVKAGGIPTPQFRANVELQTGALYLERGRWDEALARFRRADALFPGFWLIQEHIAETLALKGDTTEAERLYADIVRRTGHPEFMDVLAGLARARGDGAAAEAWTRRAAAGWERRLKLFPEAAYGHALDHFLSSGDAARALEIAQRNHAARPYGDAKVQLAEALLKAGRPEAARQTIEAVLASPWRTAPTHAVAARVYAATGAGRLAAAQRAKALAIDPHVLDAPARPLKVVD